MTEKTSKPVIVTNKHVVKDATRGRFLLTRKGPSGEPLIGQTVNFEIDDFEKRWIPHPDNDVDLCVLPIGGMLNQLFARHEEVFWMPFDASLIPTAADEERMIGLESVLMVGYPNGLWDNVNNLPIFRRGSLASDYKVDWRGKKEFLIDCACFPGSSGSPVMLFDIGGYQDKGGMNIGAARIKLMGVLFAGPQHTADGKIVVVNVPTVQVPVPVITIPNNLGIVIKASRLHDFEHLIPD